MLYSTEFGIDEDVIYITTSAQTADGIVEDSQTITITSEVAAAETDVVALGTNFVPNQLILYRKTVTSEFFGML